MNGNNPFSDTLQQLYVKIIWQIRVFLVLLFHSSPRNISTWASSWLSSWSCHWFASFCSSRSNLSKGEARLVSTHMLITTRTEVWRTNNLKNTIYSSLTHIGPNLCMPHTQNTPKYASALFFQSTRLHWELQALSQATVALPLIDSSRVLTKSSQWRLTSGAWIRISI